MIVVDFYVYLGTPFSSHGKFSEAEKKQARKTLFVIKSRKDKYNLSIVTVLNLFYEMILPVLLYGCEIWRFEFFEI